MYSEIVMDHFKNPRNVGKIEDADGVGEVGNPQCGDMMTVYIKVVNDRIDDIKFQTFGCGAAVAVSSMITEMAKHKTLEEASRIGNKEVAKELGGLPKKKLHCSNLGADALQMAIRDYRFRRAGEDGPPVGTGGHGQFIMLEQPAIGESACECPYCDVIMPEPAPFCTTCGADSQKDQAK